MSAGDNKIKIKNFDIKIIGTISVVKDNQTNIWHEGCSM
jgi:hypothetical protein